MSDLSVEPTRLRPIRHLSASALSDFFRCPALWWFKRIGGIGNDWSSPEQELGTAIHAALQAHHEGKDAVNGLLGAWTELKNPQPQAAFPNSLALVREYAGSNEPLPGVDRCELKFTMRIPGVPVPIIGFIDRMRNARLHEYKTGQTKWTQEKIDNELQATCYWRAWVDSNSGAHPDCLSYHWLRLFPTPQYVRLDTIRDQEDMEEFDERVRQAWVRMQRIVKGEESVDATCKPASWCRFSERCERIRAAGGARSDALQGLLVLPARAAGSTFLPAERLSGPEEGYVDPFAA